VSAPQGKPKVRPSMTLDDLMSRCTVDEDTGCWTWKHYIAYGTTPIVRFQGRAQSARRAAVILNGQKVPQKHFAILQPTCACTCVNPAHIKVVNGSAYILNNQAHHGLNGPAHKAKIAAGVRKRAGTKIRGVEHAADLRMRVASGECRQTLADEAGITRAHLNRIARGDQWADRAMPKGASVFAWARQA